MAERQQDQQQRTESADPLVRRHSQGDPHGEGARATIQIRCEGVRLLLYDAAGMTLSQLDELLDDPAPTPPYSMILARLRTWR